MKMLKRIVSLLCTLVMLLALVGCGKNPPKIGVSFGVGKASRWVEEEQYMIERAEELGIALESRLETEGDAESQKKNCFELIDSGINVLILTPKDITGMDEILEYAAKKNVKVVNYARVIQGNKVDLFVGYDCKRIGQSMGEYLTELVYEGDYIILNGDPNDNNARLIREGAMEYIDLIRGDIHILLEDFVPNWDPETAKKMVKEAVAANGNHVDAILAPNDKLAGASAAALAELGVTESVVITGMDAELEAIRRIVAGTQSMTVHMVLKEMAYSAVDAAYAMATGKTVTINASYDNDSGPDGVNASLISGRQVIKQNIDSVLIDPGYFTREEVYGE